MNTREILHLFYEIKYEVEAMRNRITHLTAKAEAYDLLRSIMDLKDNYSGCEQGSPDLAYRLNEAIDSIEDAIEDEHEPVKGGIFDEESEYPDDVIAALNAHGERLRAAAQSVRNEPADIATEAWRKEMEADHTDRHDQRQTIYGRGLVAEMKARQAPVCLADALEEQAKADTEIDALLELLKQAVEDGKTANCTTSPAPDKDL